MPSNGIPSYSTVFEAGGLDAFTNRPQYDFQPPGLHLSDTFLQQPLTYGSSEPRDASQSLSIESPTTNTDRTVRRRISRACDQCNKLRTKCDGKQPCDHCEQLSLTCEYARAKKRRGKAPTKGAATKRPTGAAPTVLPAEGPGCNPTSVSPQEDLESVTVGDQHEARGVKRKRSSIDIRQLPHTLQMSIETPFYPTTNNIAYCPPMPEAHYSSVIDGTSAFFTPIPDQGMQTLAINRITGSENDQGTILHPVALGTDQNTLRTADSLASHPMVDPNNIHGYEGPAHYTVHPLNGEQDVSIPRYVNDLASPTGMLGTYASTASREGPRLASISDAQSSGTHDLASEQLLRYPVLLPLLPYLTDVIPVGLACDLLEMYFASAPSFSLHPQSPYILGYTFRKRSFLRPNNPRRCSPSLLASMLWVAAQTSDSPYLTSPSLARNQICQKLFKLTVSLLRPLIHATPDEPLSYDVQAEFNGIASGGFAVVQDSQQPEMAAGVLATDGTLDDVATYIHVATIISASERKGASVRWWNTAWSLARELKLCNELPPSSEPENSSIETSAPAPRNIDTHASPYRSANTPRYYLDKEEREERRRVWWLLYAMDRHLALCYNRPLFLLDTECADLLQPVSDVVWQEGEFYSGEHRSDFTDARCRGPPLDCSGHSIFGFFLPLMTILGEIVHLRQAQNHPRVGLNFHNDHDGTSPMLEISRQLEAYNQSLNRFEIQNTGSRQLADSGSTIETRGDGKLTDTNLNNQSTQYTGPEHVTRTSKYSTLRTKAAIAYGTYIMHTLQVLLNSHWDPISLLDDNDSWISTPSFISAMAHAVSASEALNDVLDYDPDLSFMPFFFGIYLLRASFMFLLIAEKVQGDASSRIFTACETIVRAHEACIVTLNTEYQRNFRKVMQSAIAQLRGRTVGDIGEQQKRRREVLALYRWTCDGTGLAI